MEEFIVLNKVEFDEVQVAISGLEDHVTTKTKDSTMVGYTSIVSVHYECQNGNQTARKFVNILQMDINQFTRKVQS